MPRHIVCMSFDVDIFSGFLSRGLTSPTPVSRGEFGLIGLKRILKLLKDTGIPASFFMPGTMIETFPQAADSIVEAGHELGHHGWSHVPPANLSPEKEEADLIRANETIQRVSGQRARGYRSPSWDLSPHTVDLLLKHGFFYESSMMGDDHSPYYARTGDQIELDEPCRLGRPTSLIEMPISWTTDDHPHFEFFRTQTHLMPGLQNADNVLGNWIEDFLYMKRTEDWGVLTYTCHPYVIGRGHRMNMLEKLLGRLQREGAAFMTMEDAAREFAERSPAAVEYAHAG